ncbi:MAG: DJ-1/PfpI family protein [Acidobacteriota bacterium]
MAVTLVSACAGAGEGQAGWKPASVGFLIVDGVYNTELVAPFDVFQHVAGRGLEPLRAFTVAPKKQPVRTFEGLVITPDYVLEEAPPIDILVVPSAEYSTSSDLKNERLLEWVGETGRKARHVVSLCWGAFVLAEAGLLEGKAATTFPPDQETFEKRFPRVRVIRGVSFVDAGHALTSVGGVKSYDVAMYLVESIYGQEVARGIGRGLVIDWDLGEVPYYKDNN